MVEPPVLRAVTDRSTRSRRRRPYCPRTIGLAIPLAERSWPTPGTSASVSDSARPRVRSSASPLTSAVERMSVGSGVSPWTAMTSPPTGRSRSSTEAVPAAATGTVRVSGAWPSWSTRSATEGGHSPATAKRPSASLISEPCPFTVTIAPITGSWVTSSATCPSRLPLQRWPADPSPAGWVEAVPDSAATTASAPVRHRAARCERDSGDDADVRMLMAFSAPGQGKSSPTGQRAAAARGRRPDNCPFAERGRRALPSPGRARRRSRRRGLDPRSRSRSSAAPLEGAQRCSRDQIRAADRVAVTRGAETSWAPLDSQRAPPGTDPRPPGAAPSTDGGSTRPPGSNGGGTARLRRAAVTAQTS
jgi:hypothetical protein